jgi:hypothetical protein
MAGAREAGNHARLVIAWDHVAAAPAVAAGTERISMARMRF